MAAGSTLADSSQASTTKPTIWARRVSTETTLTLRSFSLMVNPTTSSEAISAMITIVKIFSPSGCLRVPESERTLAARPRLDSDRTPARASDSLKSSPKPRSSPKRSEVTTRAASSEMMTEMIAAAKYRPLMVATKPGTSISSRPTMKNSTNIPISRKS